MQSPTRAPATLQPGNVQAGSAPVVPQRAEYDSQAMARKKKIKSSHDGKFHFTNFLRNWLHQAITYMDKGERTIRLLMESGEVLILWLILVNTTASSSSGQYAILLFAIVLVHTLNWLLNGNFWALYLFAVPSARNPGEVETVRYLNEMATRLSRYDSITGLAIFGSVTRGKWHNCSDIDIRIIRKPGVTNLISASLVSIRERARAFFKRQPLDLFLADDISFLRKMRSDETPVFLIKRDSRLEREYPDNPAIALERLAAHPPEN